MIIQPKSYSIKLLQERISDKEKLIEDLSKKGKYWAHEMSLRNKLVARLMKLEEQSKGVENGN
jgi:hypothetical protein